MSNSRLIKWLKIGETNAGMVIWDVMTVILTLLVSKWETEPYIIGKKFEVASTRLVVTK